MSFDMYSTKTFKPGKLENARWLVKGRREIKTILTNKLKFVLNKQITWRLLNERTSTVTVITNMWKSLLFFTYLFIDFLAPQVIPVTSKGDFDLLKSRIASTKAEIRREEGVSGLNSPDSSPSMKV